MVTFTLVQTDRNRLKFLTFSYSLLRDVAGLADAALND